MVQKQVIPNDVDLFVFVSHGQWKPYRDCVPAPADPLFQAVTLPGGFTGFGPDSDAAVKMAVDRALQSVARAKRAGFTPQAWWKDMWGRLNPHARECVHMMLDTIADALKKQEHRHDGLNVKTVQAKGVERIGSFFHSAATEACAAS